MIDGQTTAHKAQFMPVTQFATELAKTGIRVFHGGPGTFWARFNFGGMMRLPRHHLVPPTSDELHQVLWHGPATVASYLLEPDERHPANTWLYLCTDQGYALEKLAPEMRRNVRRGLRELTIAPLTFDQVLSHGAQAFCDTRRRVGLSDGTLEEFHQRFSARRIPEMVNLGAWKDSQLAGFLSILEVDDWVEINANFSMDSLRQYRASDTLLYSALCYYLVERKCRVVSYGLSSIQADSKVASLHRYKKKVGFEARPVHRAFVPHPLLRPLANWLTLWGVNTTLWLKPEDQRLKKARGLLASILGDTHMLEAAVINTNDK